MADWMAGRRMSWLVGVGVLMVLPLRNDNAADC